MTQEARDPAKTAERSALVARLKAQLATLQQELHAMLASEDQAGTPLAQRHAAVMDELLRTLFEASVSATSAAPRRVLLGAVGGYGRCRLGWKSDLDVRLITPKDPKALQALSEAVLHPLWDAGVSVGHQVVTVSDAIAAAEADLPTATALLDFRALSGDAALATELRERAFASLFAPRKLARFLRRLEDDADARVQRLGDALHLLEPDVKNGAGGLRDLDVALWTARARWRVDDFRELAPLGVLLPREVDALERAADFLWAARNRLHARAGRRSDRLTFPEQEELARAMGYRARVGALPGASDDELAVTITEAFMSDYHRHARVITRSREQLLARAMPAPWRLIPPRTRKLGGGLYERAGRVAIGQEAELAADPAMALRLYATAIARKLALQPETRSMIARKAGEPQFCAALRESDEAASLFVSLLTDCQPVGFRARSILGELHDVGLLVAMLPELAPVVGRVHHDVYHVYTVDVHSVACVDHLRALRRGELRAQHPLATKLLAGVASLDVLLLAALLHDIGETLGATDHERRGAEMARVILTRLKRTPDEVDTVCRLVGQHLAMYHVAVQRDLEDPATVAEFVRELGGREGLRALYVLTIADLSTTGPTPITRWKEGMLDALYAAAEACLEGGASGTPERIAGVCEQVAACADAALQPDFLTEFLRTMPERYLLASTPAEIAAHALCASRVRGTKVSASLVPSRHADVAELCVVTEGAGLDSAGLCVVAGDRPGLLAAIAAVIAANRLEVHAAQIHSRALPGGAVQAVDVFWVRDPIDGSEGVERALPKLEHDLRAVIGGDVTPQRLLQKQLAARARERPGPPVSTAITVDQDGSHEHTVIEVVTKDRRGLLFTLATTLHEQGLSIALAKINTEGTRVADVFYVTEADGKKLASAQRAEAVRAALFAVLPPAEARVSWSTASLP